ncbi:hypothetical protein QFC21_001805 [Naganishia friedmannii]|uniref:Uncharacterized protein n=1 Tax=Naganishia friedmannii TaxID=89922 RepID=A0ACC2W2I2_9TREE|nr:hypothetical protein QFC21_001805 [Naganishia friedmannii]
MSLVKQQFDARRLHPEAVPIPRVRGRWPFNTDILMDWMASSKDEYLGEGMISRLERIYGQTLNTRVLGEDSVITTSPEHVSQMLTSSFLAFDKGAKWKERVYEMMGDGVFSSDGSLWKYHRATIRPFFGHSRAPLEEILEPHTSKFVTVLENLGSLSNGSSPRAFDVQHITRCLALDVAMSWLCGQSTGLLDECLDKDHPCKSGKTAKSEGNKVFEAFAEAQRDPKVWGPDAHVLDPRRWMGNDPRSQKGYPFGIPGFGKAAYPVFHLGPRSVGVINHSGRAPSD